MFVRKKKRPKHSDDNFQIAVQIVHNYRNEKNSPRQKVIRHVGVANSTQQLEHYVRLGEILLVELEQQADPGLFDNDTVQPQPQQTLADTSAEQLVHHGYHSTGVKTVYEPLYQAMGMHRVLPPSRYRRANRILFETVMARLEQPLSKRATAAMLAQQWGSATSLDAIYRMMDQLTDPRIARIKQTVEAASRDLFQPNSNQVVLFDCTTLYFESTKEDIPAATETPGDCLREFGYSKDHRSDRVQMVLALVINGQGLPLGYEVFKGSLYEGHTLLPVLEQLKTTYDTPMTPIVVADAGMLSKDNLKKLEQVPLKYITGARLKSLKADLKESVLNHDWSKQPITEWPLPREDDPDHPDDEQTPRRLVVWYSLKRAIRDRKLREENIEKIKKKLAKSKTPKQWLKGQGGAAKFLKVKGKSTIELDQAKIDEAARWDGLGGAVTNTTLPPEEVQIQYHGLWQIERGFRINKTDMKIRPVFHWTPRRIRAHIAICYMAFALLRQVEYRLWLKQDRMSPQQINEAIAALKDILMKDTKTERLYGYPSKPSDEAQRILRALGIKRPQTPIPYN